MQKKILLFVPLFLGIGIFFSLIKIKPVAQSHPQVLAISDTTVNSNIIPTSTPFPTPIVPNLQATAYLLKKLQHEVILEKNSHVRLFPASTTKMMTALVAINNYPLDLPVKIKTAYQIGANIDLQVNEVISLENLLYGLLLNSGNDAAMAIAGISNPDEFIANMNKLSYSMGLKDTQFVNPSGLDHPDHYSTAYDLAIIGESLLSNPKLSEIVSTSQTTVYDVDHKIAHHLENRNKLLSQSGVIGIKTGYTDTAGEVLVTAVIRNNQIYIISVMDSQDRFADTQKLIEWLDLYLVNNSF